MVIDFHVHCFPDDLAGRAVLALASTANIKPRVDGTIDGIKLSMKSAGISRSIVLPVATKPSQAEKLNYWAADIQSEEIIAFGSIHPDSKDWKNELKMIKELGLKGIKLHPDYQLFFIDEKRMFPIYELAAELGLIIMLHAGVDIGLPEPYHCNPKGLLNMVKNMKGAKIVAAHMGGYAYWDDVERFLVGEDIFFDTAYSLGFVDSSQLKRIIKNHGYRKILFATDSPWCDQGEEIKKLKDLGLGNSIENAILGKNAEALLNLREI